MVNVSRAAKAAATKKNNVIVNKYPLLAPAITDWLTTPEDEQERLDRQHKIAEIHMLKIRQVHIEFIELGPKIKEYARFILPEDVFLSVSRTADYCPSDYMAGLFSNALAGHLQVPRGEMWETMKSKFIGGET